MIENKEKIGVLFVCMGNICRSPTAEGVFRKLVNDAGLADRILIDSAGTHAYHQGEPADRRAQAAALRRGYTLTEIKARRVESHDYTAFAYIVAMDSDNLENLRDSAPAEASAKLIRFLDFSSGSERDVPDPYYGGTAGFERVLDLVEEGAQGLLNRIRSELQ